MPFEPNTDRRHHTPKQRQKVTSWAEYDAGLCARGSLTVWFTAKTIEGWQAETLILTQPELNLRPINNRQSASLHFHSTILAPLVRWGCSLRV